MFGMFEGFSQGYIDDFSAPQRYHVTEFPLSCQADCSRAIAGGELPVKCRWRAAALEVPEHGHPRLYAAAIFQFFGNSLADSAQARERSLRRLKWRSAVLRQLERRLQMPK
jgi:hypothetical protein